MDANQLIWREVERRAITVSEDELAQTVARTYGEGAAIPNEHVRRELQKTIAFGKLKGEVTDEVLGPHGRPWLAGLDLPARRVIRDALFLYWVRQALPDLLGAGAEPEAP
jgi:hypothetical protein